MPQKVLVNIKNDNAEDVIRKAGKNLRIVRIRYRKADGTSSDRNIEPYSIKNYGLYGYDTEKNGIRFFKLSGIMSAKETKKNFSPRWPVEL